MEVEYQPPGPGGFFDEGEIVDFSTGGEQIAESKTSAPKIPVSDEIDFTLMTADEANGDPTGRDLTYNGTTTTLVIDSSDTGFSNKQDPEAQTDDDGVPDSNEQPVNRAIEADDLLNDSFAEKDETISVEENNSVGHAIYGDKETQSADLADYHGTDKVSGEHAPEMRGVLEAFVEDEITYDEDDNWQPALSNRAEPVQPKEPIQGKVEAESHEIDYEDDDGEEIQNHSTQDIADDLERLESHGDPDDVENSGHPGSRQEHDEGNNVDTEVDYEAEIEYEDDGQQGQGDEELHQAFENKEADLMDADYLHEGTEPELLNEDQQEMTTGIKEGNGSYKEAQPGRGPSLEENRQEHTNEQSEHRPTDAAGNMEGQVADFMEHAQDENDHAGGSGEFHNSDEEIDFENKPASQFSAPSDDSFTPDITVLYKGDEYPLFSSAPEADDKMVFFRDLSVLDYTMDGLLAAFREELSGDLGPEEDIIFQVDELGLEYSESTQTDHLASVTLRQILQVFDVLVKNQHPNTPRALYTFLCTRLNPSKRFALLAEQASAGKPLETVRHFLRPPALEDGIENQAYGDVDLSEDGGEDVPAEDGGDRRASVFVEDRTGAFPVKPQSPDLADDAEHEETIAADDNLDEDSVMADDQESIGRNGEAQARFMVREGEGENEGSEEQQAGQFMSENLEGEELEQDLVDEHDGSNGFQERNDDGGKSQLPSPDNAYDDNGNTVGDSHWTVTDGEALNLETGELQNTNLQKSGERTTHTSATLSFNGDDALDSNRVNLTEELGGADESSLAPRLIDDDVVDEIDWRDGTEEDENPEEGDRTHRTSPSVCGKRSRADDDLSGGEDDQDVKRRRS